MTPAEGLRNAAAPDHREPRGRGGQDPAPKVPGQTRITCFGPGPALRPGFLSPNHEAERSSLGPHVGTPLRHHDGGGGGDKSDAPGDSQSVFPGERGRGESPESRGISEGGTGQRTLGPKSSLPSHPFSPQSLPALTLDGEEQQLQEGRARQRSPECARTTSARAEPVTPTRRNEQPPRKAPGWTPDPRATPLPSGPSLPGRAPP